VGEYRVGPLALRRPHHHDLSPHPSLTDNTAAAFEVFQRLKRKLKIFLIPEMFMSKLRRRNGNPCRGVRGNGVKKGTLDGNFKFFWKTPIINRNDLGCLSIIDTVEFL